LQRGGILNKLFYFLTIVLLPSLFNVLTFSQESFTLNISLKFPMDFESDALINNLKIAGAELSYVYEISIFGGDYSATISSTSTVLSLEVSQQGLYEISASVMVGKDTYFKGVATATVDYSSLTQDIEILLKPVMSKMLITLDINDVDELKGKRILITSKDSSRVVFNELLDVSIFPLMIDITPGSYKVDIVAENNVTSNSTKALLSTTELKIQPGRFYPLMVSFKKETLTLSKNLAKVSKLIAFDINTREVIFEREGKYKLSKSLSINGKNNSSWSNVLFPGICDLYLVFEDGEITSISYEENFPSRVRVLLSSKQTSVGGLLSSGFEQVTVKPHQDYLLFVFDNTYYQVMKIQSGCVVRFQNSSEGLSVETADGIIGPFQKSSRFYIRPLSKDSSIEIAEKGKNKYSGTFEIIIDNNGRLSIINDLSIEEYLKSVVSSEMPSTYHPEALKAQAVASRTYTLSKILSDRRYARLGANIDDSTNFQAYNFQKPNEKASKAVMETEGEILVYRGKPAETFYFAVSGGYLMDPADVFTSKIIYLTPKIMSFGTEMPLSLDDEMALLNFLKNWNFSLLRDLGFPEAINGYFRWKVEYSPEELLRILKSLKGVTTLNLANAEILKSKYKPTELLTDFVNLVLKPRLSSETANTNITKVENDFFEIMSTLPEIQVQVSTTQQFQDISQESIQHYGDFSDIQQERIINVYVTRRTPGKYVKEVIVETNKGLYKISDEQVLKLFSPQGKKVVLRNGIVRSDFSSLPSSFFTVDVVKNDYGYAEKVVLYGGGFGHGIGMSQVAVNFLAKDYGWDYITILSFFYPGTVLSKVY